MSGCSPIELVDRVDVVVDDLDSQSPGHFGMPARKDTCGRRRSNVLNAPQLIICCVARHTPNTRRLPVFKVLDQDFHILMSTDQIGPAELLSFGRLAIDRRTELPRQDQPLNEAVFLVFVRLLATRQDPPHAREQDMALHAVNRVPGA
jgi:hypothetical protein